MDSKAMHGPIGVFDSGYGGLTILKELVRTMPEYDYMYLGDNARAPYGTRSYESVYRFTYQCVQFLFSKGCPIVILACNTASAKALRNIQQKKLPEEYPDRRVLGVIRPTTEDLKEYTKTNAVGVLGTTGTVNSMSYPTEINKFFPEIEVFQNDCPMWVPLVENDEYASDGADYFIKKELDRLFKQSNKIDTVILACTHYPLLLNKIKKYVPANTTILSQAEIVASKSLQYLSNHPEIEERITRNRLRQFFTTDSTEIFDKHSSIFFGEEVTSEKVEVRENA